MESPNRTTEIEQKVSQKIEELSRVADGVGKGIEAGIVETVAVFNLLGFHTEQSCEGHLDRAAMNPWVRISHEGEPEWKFIGEKEAFETLKDCQNIWNGKSLC